MPAFPDKPWSDGDKTNDGRYVYADPPGVWRVVSSDLSDFDTFSTKLSVIEQDYVSRPVFEQLEDRVGAQAVEIAPIPQVVSDAGTLVEFDLNTSRTLIVTGTTSSFAVAPINLQTTNKLIVTIAFELTDVAHDPTLFFDGWEGSAPTLSSLATGKVHVFRGEWIPVFRRWIGRYLGEFDPVDTVISKPTVTIVESDETPVDSGTLSGVTNLKLDLSTPSNISSVEWYVDPVNSASLPSDPFSSTAYVRSVTSPPFKMLALDWDTETDPTDNNRAAFDSDGAHEAAAKIYWIDGTSTVETANFTITNSVTTPNLPAAPTISSVTGGERQIIVDWDPVDGALGYDVFYSTTDPPPSDAIPVTVTGTDGGELGTPSTSVTSELHTLITGDNPSTTMTINAGSDRILVVSAMYNSAEEMTSITVGGVSATNRATSSYYNTSLERGIWFGTIPEASFPSTGSQTVQADFASSVGAGTETHFHVWEVTGVKSPTGYVGDASLNFVQFGDPTLDLSATVPANAAVFISMGQQFTAGGAQTASLVEDGVSSVSTGSEDESIAEYSLDDGASGSKTYTITSHYDGGGSPNRSTAGFLAFTYTPATSGGGTPGDAPTILTITGLADSTTYYAQVAAFNSSDQRGSRSTASSATTDSAPVTPTPGNPSDRPLNHGFNKAYENVAAFGGGQVNSSTFSIPRSIYRRYMASWNLSWLGGWMESFALPDAVSKWDTVSGRGDVPQVALDIGPRAVFNLGSCPFWRTRSDGSKYTAFNVIGKQDSVSTMLEMASVLGGDYDSQYVLAAQNIRDFRGAGYDDWPSRVSLTLGLEGNGNWATEYSGYDDYLIGNSTLATYTHPNPTVQSVVRSVATAGNRGLVTKAVYEHIVNVMRNVSGCENLSFDTAYAALWNIQTEADPAAPGSNDINFTGIPDNLDAYGFNCYFRGNGRFQYIGDGDMQTDVNTSNWSSPTQSVAQSVWDNICVPRQASFCVPELGISMQSSTSSSNFGGASGDLQARIAAKWMMEDFLPSVDLAYSLWWSLDDSDPENYAGESFEPLNNQADYPRYVAELARLFPPF